MQVGSELDAKARSAMQAHVVEYADALTAAFEAVTPPSAAAPLPAARGLCDRSTWAARAACK